VTRRGSILLEILLAIVLFAGATAFTIGALRGALGSTERSAIKLRAADLARTTISEIEAGVVAADATAERTATADPDGLRVESKTSQSSFPGLSLCEVIVYGPGDDGEARILYELRQLVRAAGRTAGASHGGGL